MASRYAAESNLDESKARRTDPGSVCRFFERDDSSLIEEPEICEHCRYMSGELCTLPQPSA